MNKVLLPFEKFTAEAEAPPEYDVHKVLDGS